MSRSVDDITPTQVPAQVPAPKPASLESARRVLALLLAFSKERHTLSTRELAADTGIPLPTVYRYVAFLRQEGLLVDRGGATYSLSTRVVSLAAAAEASETLIDVADPIMRRLSEQAEETVILVRLIAGAAVCVHQIESRHRLRITFEPGQPVSLEGGASARLLLASLSAPARQAQLAALAERDPERAAWLENEVAIAGERGWAISEQEIDRGIWAASGAVRNGGGAIVASLTIPSPLVGAEAPLQKQLLGQVRTAAEEISAALRAA